MIEPRKDHFQIKESPALLSKEETAQRRLVADAQREARLKELEAQALKKAAKG